MIINKLKIELLLLHPSEEPLPATTLAFQYYSFTDESWIHLYEQTLNSKGGLIISAVRRTGMPAEETDFFNLISDNQLPPIRVIPTEVYEDISLQPVIGSTFSFDITSSGTLEIDFGNLWLVPEALITDENSIFPDFIPITSHYKVAVPTDNTPLPVNELYTNLISEITTASDSSDSPFKLSNISLKLKALVQRDGETVNASLLDLDNSRHINGNAISELVFDITAVQQTDSTDNQMPDLTGLTETAVRRILKTFGLRLNPVYQKNMDVVNGDSFKQSPAAEETIQPNQLVTVIFSKHE
jgi:hypothetical protein